MKTFLSKRELLFRFLAFPCLLAVSDYFLLSAFARGTSFAQAATFHAPAFRHVKALREQFPRITAISVHIRPVNVHQEGRIGPSNFTHLGHMYVELWAGRKVPYRTLEAGPSGPAGTGFLIVHHYLEHPASDTEVFLKFGTGSVDEMTRAGQRLSLEQDLFAAHHPRAVPYGEDINNNNNSYVIALFKAYGCRLRTWSDAVGTIQDKSDLTAVGSQTAAQIAIFMEPNGRPFTNTRKCSMAP